MKERRAKTVIGLAVVWIVIVGLLAVAYRYFVKPAADEKLADETGSASRYEHEITLALDSFSGYSIIRSEALAADLGNQGIRLSIEDDGADYVKRVEALRDGDVDLAVFTVDSYIAAGAAVGEFPGSIVLVIDETKGADAIVAYSQGVQQITDLNHADARLVLTPNSPSEFLARTVIAHFNLPQLPRDWLVAADGAGDVYEKFRKADKRARRAYVLWEPYVSKALREDGAAVLLDSSRLEGYIVDVLVARRSFLRDEPELARSFVESYLRAAYSYRTEPDGMIRLVREDAAKSGGEKLDQDRAAKLVEGILWKNTLENYAHFGLLPAAAARGLPHIEDIITNITNVLLQTDALKQNLVAGEAHKLFYDRILKDVQGSNFHPARKLNLISGAGAGDDDLEEVRKDEVLAPLTEAQWNSLVEVGELRTEPISFGRGTARINLNSQRELAGLAQRLKSWPHYYLTVVGHARAVGDPQANLKLAEERAAAAIEVLREAGLPEQRVRAKAVTLSGRGGEAQSVSFVVGQMPY